MSQSVLDTNVLVLNRFYMAIRVINVRRALTLLYRDCAEVIDLEGGQYASYNFDSWCELSELTSMEKQPGGLEIERPRPDVGGGHHHVSSLHLRIDPRHAMRILKTFDLEPVGASVAWVLAGVGDVSGMAVALLIEEPLHRLRRRNADAVARPGMFVQHGIVSQLGKF